jgi:hypothetical protein
MATYRPRWARHHTQGWNSGPPPTSKTTCTPWPAGADMTNPGSGPSPRLMYYHQLYHGRQLGVARLSQINQRRSH